jgi:RNA polymerase sigma factor (sigma-70 family)
MIEGRTRSYIVDNDEILLLVDSWNAACPSRKSLLAGQLVSRLSFLVHSRIRGYKGSALYDDLLQEGRIAIVKALERFSPERGKNFFAFANWHIHTGVRNFLKSKGRRGLRETPVGDISAFDEACGPHDAVEEREDRSAIMEALGFLPDSHRRVLVMRFGFDGEEPRTLQQIGDALGFSRERARQIESGALGRLRRNKELRCFFSA